MPNRLIANQISGGMLLTRLRVVLAIASAVLGGSKATVPGYRLRHDVTPGRWPRTNGACGNGVACLQHGIRRRGSWPAGTKPSDLAAGSGKGQGRLWFILDLLPWSLVAAPACAPSSIGRDAGGFQGVSAGGEWSPGRRRGREWARRAEEAV